MNKRLNKPFCLVSFAFVLGVLSISCASDKIDTPTSPSGNQTTQTQPSPQPPNPLAGPFHMSIWWPTESFPFYKGSTPQPFKAQLKTGEAFIALNLYQMYWQVDDRDLHQMKDSNEASPHKEDLVDVMAFNGNGNDKYKITFVAKDNSGKELNKTDVVITVDHR